MASDVSQVRVAAAFAVRVSASHALTLYLAWLAFTRGSASLGGMVLVAKAVTGIVVPLLIGRLHDRGVLSPLLRVAAVCEAFAALALVAIRSSESGGGAAAVVLALLLGATSSLFDTAVYPLLLAARPGRLHPHVLVGLAYDVAKVAGSSAVLLLLAATASPLPVMAVSLLSLAGWHLTRTDPSCGAAGSAAPVPPSVSASMSHATWAARRRAAAPVVALMTVTLLPGQLVVYQTVLASGSFERFAVLGTLFAVGAVVGNVALQRVAVSPAAAAFAYLVTGAGLAVAVLSPFVSMLLFGAGTASHYQLTRALVVGSVAADQRGRASGRMTACAKVAGVVGALLAASLVDQPSVMAYTGATFALVAALVVLAAGREHVR